MAGYDEKSCWEVHTRQKSKLIRAPANTVSGGRMRRIAARAGNPAGGDQGKCEAPDDARRRLVRGRNAYRELGLPVREGAGRMPRNLVAKGAQSSRSRGMGPTPKFAFSPPPGHEHVARTGGPPMRITSNTGRTSKRRASFCDTPPECSRRGAAWVCVRNLTPTSRRRPAAVVPHRDRP